MIGLSAKAIDETLPLLASHCAIIVILSIIYKATAFLADRFNEFKGAWLSGENLVDPPVVARLCAHEFQRLF